MFSNCISSGMFFSCLGYKCVVVLSCLVSPAVIKLSSFHYCYPRWVSATVTKVFGTHNVNVCIYLRGSTCWHHIEQLQPRYGSEEDSGQRERPLQLPSIQQPAQDSVTTVDFQHEGKTRRTCLNPRLPTTNEYGPHNSRRSVWLHKPQASVSSP